MSRSSRLTLYWCETADHCEDWFVVARRKTEAQRFFEKAEGFGKGCASVQPVMILPVKPDLKAVPGWPSEEWLEGVGATFVRRETPRVVELNGVRFVEGMLEHQVRQRADDIFQMHGRGRPNKTRRERPM